MFISNILVQVLFAAAAFAVPAARSDVQLAARTDEASLPHIFDPNYAGAFITGQKVYLHIYTYDENTMLINS